jgi:hypothetical protein
MALLTTSRCAKCGGPVDRESYVIGYCRDTAMQWIYLCVGCEAGLREWMMTGETGPQDAQLDSRKTATAQLSGHGRGCSRT